MSGLILQLAKSLKLKAAIEQLTNVSSQGRQEDWEVVRMGLLHTEMEIGTKFHIFLQQILSPHFEENGNPLQ